MTIEANTGTLPDTALRSLELREWREDEVDTFAALMDAHHYLGCPDPRKRHLCQVVLYEDQVVALLIWSVASAKLKARDQVIGWDHRTRQKRLKYIVQNSRFLLLPKKRPANLASCVLGMAVQALAQAWESKGRVRPLLAETFVDPEGYRGTCYNAAGWQRCGLSAGFSRVNGKDYYQDNEHPKVIWIKPLVTNALERLRDPSKLLPGEDPRARAYGAFPVSAAQARSLQEALRHVKDPRSRARRQFPLYAILTTTVLALCCGEKTVSGVFRFCQDLNARQRAILGFRPSREAPRVVPFPSEVCWRNILRAVDPKELSEALNQWMQSQCKDAKLPPILAIDGKVIGNNLATLVSLVDARDGTPVAQAAAPGNGKEHALATELINALPQGALEGKTVTGDALYANRNLVREIVQEQGGDVLVQLKSNQPTTEQLVTQHLAHAAPPFCPLSRNSSMAGSRLAADG